MTTENMLLVDKPSGITSFDVIRRLRRELGIKKMGHAGTLDPLASGLMIVGIGPSTKQLSEHIKLPKEYIAEIRIGESRTTGDIDGEIVNEKRVDVLEEAEVERTLMGMVGVLRLPVPAFAAVKQNGVRLYKKARQGQEIELPIRDMEVTQAEFQRLSCTEGQCVVRVRFMVASGVYIRSLAEELGRRLGYPATIQALRRTKVGEFSVEDARSV